VVIVRRSPPRKLFLSLTDKVKQRILSEVDDASEDARAEASLQDTGNKFQADCLIPLEVVGLRKTLGWQRELV
jgi:hypothetical protein